MTIKGLKEAVGDFKRLNSGGVYSPHYGVLMYDKSNGRVWTDEFYSLGHNQWKVYQSESIINLSSMMQERGVEVNMKNVRAFIESL